MRIVGMAIVPADDIGGGAASRKVFADNPERSPRRSANGVDDSVMRLDQFGMRYMQPDLDVEIQVHRVPGQGALECIGCSLGVKMIRGNTIPYQAAEYR